MRRAGLRLKAADVEVIAPNFKRRLSGVTSTIVQLIPRQAETLSVAVVGPGLPAGLPRMRPATLPGLWRKPRGRPFRIWHARRNNEMIAGLVLRDLLRMPMRLVFTSAAQRRHKPLTKWLISRMDAVIATSAGSAAFLDAPHTVVMHGIDTGRFRPAANAAEEFAASGLPGRHAIGCFGRIRHQKGTDLFVEAMIRLLPENPEWTAIITGRVTAENREFAQKLKAAIAEAGLADRILLLGEVPDIAEWYRRIAIYVAPSRNEGFGLTPLEAMASGAAVVASDAGAYAELVDQGRTGAVVPAGDLEALTAAIAPYMGDPQLAAAHGRAGLERARRQFSVEAEAGAIAAVYEALWHRGD